MFYIATFNVFLLQFILFRKSKSALGSGLRKSQIWGYLFLVVELKTILKVLSNNGTALVVNKLTCVNSDFDLNDHASVTLLSSPLRSPLSSLLNSQHKRDRALISNINTTF